MLMLQLLNFMRMISLSFSLIRCPMWVSFGFASLSYDRLILMHPSTGMQFEMLHLCVNVGFIYLSIFSSIKRLRNVICMCNDEFAIMSFSECVFYHCSS